MEKLNIEVVKDNEINKNGRVYNLSGDGKMDNNNNVTEIKLKGISLCAGKILVDFRKSSTIPESEDQVLLPMQEDMIDRETIPRMVINPFPFAKDPSVGISRYRFTGFAVILTKENKLLSCSCGNTVWTIYDRRFDSPVCTLKECGHSFDTTEEDKHNFRTVLISGDLGLSYEYLSEKSYYRDRLKTYEDTATR